MKNECEHMIAISIDEFTEYGALFRTISHEKHEYSELASSIMKRAKLFLLGDRTHKVFELDEPIDSQQKEKREMKVYELKQGVMVNLDNFSGSKEPMLPAKDYDVNFAGVQYRCTKEQHEKLISALMDYELEKLDNEKPSLDMPELNHEPVDELKATTKKSLFGKVKCKPK